jgi:hypothetical protein
MELNFDVVVRRETEYDRPDPVPERPIDAHVVTIEPEIVIVPAGVAIDESAPSRREAWSSVSPVRMLWKRMKVRGRRTMIMAH